MCREPSPFPSAVSRASAAARRRGFTAVELLVVVVILLILLSIFIPFLRKTRETDRRVRCSANLSTLRTAMQKYSGANGGDYPRVVHDAANIPSGYYAFTGTYAPNPFAGDGRIAVNDVTASLFLLVRQGYARPADFVCPSTGDYADTMTDAGGQRTAVENRSNFKRTRNLSYSVACPFSTAPGYRFNDGRFKPDMVLLADKNPGRADGSDVTAPVVAAAPLELARANSINHGRAGQNVLFGDGHVEFRQTPYTGYGYAPPTQPADNIYTAMAPRPLPEDPQPTLSANGVVGREYGPAWKWDTYLVPTADDERK